MRARPRGPAREAVLLAAAALALTGCGSSAEQAVEPGAGDGTVHVVASTDVWGSIAQAVGGAAIEVRRIIDNPSADPHSYESSPTDAAAVADADLVVFNGGGYDQFMEQLLRSTAGDKPTVEAFALVAESGGEGTHEGEAPAGQETAREGTAEPGGEQHAHEAGMNEHVWYDLPTVELVADEIAEQLSALRPEQAETFAGNAEEFGQGIDELSGRVAEIAERHRGTRVALTEPLAVELLKAAGLQDVTPDEFVEAVEEETDPPAAAVEATRQLLTGRQVALLVYNPQTETPVTQQIRATAEAVGVPVVEMTETLPEDTDYLTWMGDQIDALAEAVSRP